MTTRGLLQEYRDLLDLPPHTRGVSLPVGNAGNITAYWAEFKQYHQIKSTGLPHMLGVQATVVFRVGDLDMLGEAMTDRLHQPYRIP